MLQRDSSRDIRLISGERPPKPATIVVAETRGVREREPYERLHLRNDPTNPLCSHCSRFAKAWFDSEDRWALSPSNCSL